jgi:hypothetical protein
MSYASTKVEPLTPTSRVLLDIEAERLRQVRQEGWSDEHDDTHENRELAFAAACYTEHYASRAWLLGSDLAESLNISPEDGALDYAGDPAPDEWPIDWGDDAWKPKDARRDLVRAAALIVAEIERLDRAC